MCLAAEHARVIARKEYEALTLPQINGGMPFRAGTTESLCARMRGNSLPHSARPTTSAHARSSALALHNARFVRDRAISQSKVFAK